MNNLIREGINSYVIKVRFYGNYENRIFYKLIFKIINGYFKY